MKRVVIIGGGAAGLMCGYELRRKNYEITIIEASNKVGGRVQTERASFAKGLHGELGAMRIPNNHEFVKHYLEEFELDTEAFEQKNRIIYFSQSQWLLAYDEFEARVRSEDPELYSLFPEMRQRERGKTPDELWELARAPVEKLKDKIIENGGKRLDVIEAVTEKYDHYSLRDYFEEIAKWSPDCIRFYETCSAHVVLDNSFIDSWIDGFLSSQKDGANAGMTQIVGGMDGLSSSFFQNKYCSLDDVTWLGWKAEEVVCDPSKDMKISVFASNSGQVYEFEAHYVIFAVPAPAFKTIETYPAFSISKNVALKESRYVDVMKILLQFRLRWWEEVMLEVGDGLSGGMISDLNLR